MFKRCTKPLIASLIIFLTPWLAMTATGQEYIMDLNKTEILHLPAPAGAVIVGNPSIADISVHSPNTIFILGRSYGRTNIIVLDELGQIVLDASILVKNITQEGSVRLHNVGQGRESYTCTPECLPTPLLGDRLQFVALNSATSANIVNSPVISAANTADTLNVQTLQQDQFGNSAQQDLNGEPAAQSLAPSNQNTSPPTSNNNRGAGRGQPTRN